MAISSTFPPTNGMLALYSPKVRTVVTLPSEVIDIDPVNLMGADNSAVATAVPVPSASGTVHSWRSVTVRVSPTNDLAYEGTLAGMVRVTMTVVPPPASSMTSESTVVDPVLIARWVMKSASVIIARTADGWAS